MADEKTNKKRKARMKKKQNQLKKKKEKVRKLSARDFCLSK